MALALFDHMSSSKTIKAMLLTSRHLCTTSSGTKDLFEDLMNYVFRSQRANIFAQEKDKSFRF